MQSHIVWLAMYINGILIKYIHLEYLDIGYTIHFLNREDITFSRKDILILNRLTESKRKEVH